MTRATGGFYAVRRRTVRDLPLILGGVAVAMTAAQTVARVEPEPRVLGRDDLPPRVKEELRPKVRAFFGNHQVLCLAPSLLSVKKLLGFEFVCNKLFHLSVPFELIAMTAASLFLPALLYQLSVPVASPRALVGALASVPVPSRLASRFTSLALVFLLLHVKSQVWVRT